MKSTTLVFAVIVGCAFAVMPPVSNLNFIECEACTLLEPEFQMLINKEEPVVEKDLDSICDRIPFIAKTCVNFVNSHIEKLVDALNKDGTNPKQVCIDIGACKAAVVEAMLKPTVFGLECSICDAVVPFAEKEIAGEGPQATAALDKICGHLGIFKDECEDLVNKYMGELVNALKNGADADAVCKDLGFCSSMKAIVKADAEQASRAARVQINAGGAKCFLCHLLGPELEALAGKEEPVVQKDLDMLCEKVLGWEHALMQDCVNYINKEGAMIAKVLSEDDGSGAKVLCEKIGWCSSSLVEKVKVADNKFDIKCLACHTLGPELERLAKQEEPVVEKDLEHVCSLIKFDHSLETKCDAWLEKEGAMIAKVLTEDAGSDAHVLCEKIGWC